MEVVDSEIHNVDGYQLLSTHIGRKCGRHCGRHGRSGSYCRSARCRGKGNGRAPPLTNELSGGKPKVAGIVWVKLRAQCVIPGWHVTTFMIRFVKTKVVDSLLESIGATVSACDGSQESQTPGHGVTNIIPFGPAPTTLNSCTSPSFDASSRLVTSENWSHLPRSRSLGTLNVIPMQAVASWT